MSVSFDQLGTTLRRTTTFLTSVLSIDVSIENGVPASAVPGDRKCVLDEHELYGGTQKVCAEVELEDEFILIATTTEKKIGNVCIVCLHNTPFT